MAKGNMRSDIKTMVEQGPDAAKAHMLAHSAGSFLNKARADRSAFKEKYVVGPAKVFIEHYRSDPWLRATLSLQFSTVINLLFAFYQGYSAYARESFWFATLAIYYVLLVVLRFVIANYLQTMAADGREELRRYRRCGIILFLLSIVVIIMGEVINRIGQKPEYAGHMIFVMAVFTLYNIAFALVNWVKYRKLEDPLVSVSKAIPIVSALISLYSLQTAMVVRFASESDSTLVSIISIATPALVFIAISAIAGFIVFRATWALNLFKDNE